ncbi:MAG: hypothetical protein E7655_00150 [Ruminococcaceae bacterium]|nr:hypothetical protein [Oscillospiraceae bacterium]
MKKFSRILLLALAVLMMATMAVSAADYDINNDSNVNDADVQALIEHIANGGGYISAYDIRPDSVATINILDAIALKAYVNGAILPADDNWTSYWY